ncbi:MAG: energy transducer TonB [Candidatus Latescibacteria bacterium]|nr:energy transducer TonB [Candidatus Latescibacterota bacterium]
MPSSTVLRPAILILIGSALVYWGLASPQPRPPTGSSADQPLSTRVKRAIAFWEPGRAQNRSVRVTVHVFEARPTGVLPLSLPPLEAAAVSRYGDRMLDIIRETAQYYDRLNALYPSAHFELLTAEEGMIVVKDSWLSAQSESQEHSADEGLVFPARDYLIHVTPSLLDASDWLSTQVTVERYGQLLLSYKITAPTNGTPVVIGGPIQGYPQEGGRKAVFVGLTVSFVPQATIEQARAMSRVFQRQTYDRPPHLVELAPVESPAQAQHDGLDGMSIFLAHVEADGRVTEAILVSSLHREYDEAALNAIKRSRFVPATLAGQPVDTWMCVPVQFHSPRRLPVTSAPRPHS